MKRKVLSLLFMFVFLLPIYGKTEFTDVKSGDWYYENVSHLMGDSRKIIKGYPDGSFRPSQELYKDQFITMVVRAAGFEPGNADTYWAQNYIDTAISLGFLNKGEFTDYTSTINREEMSMIIVRAVDYLEGTVVYTDLDQINQVVIDSSAFTSTYESYIQKTYKLGIITGYPDHTFKPQGVLTRAEASAVLVRLIEPNERIAFDYDSLYEQVHGNITSHLLGGANWVDPVTASDYESAQEDWGLITSNMDYGPTEYQVEHGLTFNQSLDYADGAFEYDENGPLPGHLEDFERLLQRRMPQDQVDIVMKYIEKKTDIHTYLEHDQAFFYLDNNRYLIRIDEIKLYDSLYNVKAAVSVNFNIWYRDVNFINKYENNITQIMPNTDVVIYK